MTAASSDVEARRNDGLLQAIKAGEGGIVARKLEDGACPATCTAEGVSALELSLARPSVPEKIRAAMAAALIEKGARPEDIKTLTSDMEQGLRSARLLVAAKTGALDETAQLLAAGADAGVEDVFRRSALSWAAGSGQDEIVRLLIGAGADVNAGNESGLTALMFAAQKGHTGIVGMLLDAGAGVNAAAPGYWYEGMTALMYAAAGGHAETTALLVERGAHIWMTERDNRSAEDFGRRRPGIGDILRTPPSELKQRREARELESNVVLQRKMPKMKPLAFRK